MVDTQTQRAIGRKPDYAIEAVRPTWGGGKPKMLLLSVGLVMISALDDLDALVLSFSALNSVHQPMLTRNPAGPPAREVAFEGLRLAKSAKRCAPDILDDFIQAFMEVCVRARPVQVIVPPIIAKMNLQILGGRFGWHQVGRPELTRLGLTNTAEQPFGIFGAAQEVNRFLPTGEFCLGDHDNVALAALARHDDRSACIDGFVEVA